MGRPREFDPDTALGAALNVFWSKGFEGASLTDLTEAMGITRPSLYATFGNKEELFRRALEQYETTCMAFIERALCQRDARKVAEQMLYGAADAQTDCSHPAGCLATTGAIVCSDASEPIRRTLVAIRSAKEAALCGRLERALDEGDLPSDADPAALASFIVAVIQGMAINAASGASREALYGVVRTSLKAWPT